MSHRITNKCSFCLKEVESDLKCSRCRTARYCDKVCQKQHWAVHKNICQDSNSEDSAKKLEMKASNHKDQGNFHKAEKLYRKLLLLLTNTNENDPHTLRIMRQLALTYCNQGKYAEAEKLQIECLDKQKSILGVNHHDTLMTMIVVVIKLRCSTRNV